MKVYGYARVSTNKQNIQRQVRNILEYDKTAVIYQEEYTGTKIDGRKQFEKLIKVVKPNDTIIFDSVSRFSRNAEQGFTIYQDLFNKNINLVFLKEPHINTDTYKKAISNNVQMTGTKTDIILKAVNEYLMELAKEQIRIAFEQAEKEVTDLHQRTAEGMQTAKLNGKQIGRKMGDKIETKKSKEVKQIIVKHSIDFGGTLTDVELMKMTGISRNTFYKYKRELKA